MHLRHRVVLIVAFCLVVCVVTPRAYAQARIGEAAVIKNEVVNVATTAQINVGDGVLRDETVRTGADSAARLVMADSTNLSLGPNAILKLDRTVFDDEHHYRDVAVRMTIGAFRFVTGHSDKAAYKITTPLATIGVRGTGVYTEADPEKTYVCTCYGRTQISAVADRNATENIQSRHHDAPRYVLAKPQDGKRIIPGGFRDHTDLELMTLEALVGREVPFKVSDTGEYLGPRRDY